MKIQSTRVRLSDAVPMVMFLGIGTWCVVLIYFAYTHDPLFKDTFSPFQVLVTAIVLGFFKWVEGGGKKPQAETDSAGSPRTSAPPRPE